MEENPPLSVKPALGKICDSFDPVCRLKKKIHYHSI
jgi:hypothetical protein